MLCLTVWCLILCCLVQPVGKSNIKTWVSRTTNLCFIQFSVSQLAFIHSKVQFRDPRNTHNSSPVFASSSSSRHWSWEQQRLYARNASRIGALEYLTNQTHCVIMYTLKYICIHNYCIYIYCILHYMYIIYIWVNVYYISYHIILYDIVSNSY